MTFTGRAVYDSDGTNTFHNTVAEDVSDIIGMISPRETPILDWIGDSIQPAFNVLHEWEEDSLAPSTVVSSATVSGTITYLPVYMANHPQIGNNLTVGAVLYEQTTGEYMQVTAASGNTITVTRGFGGSTAATVTSTDKLTVVSAAALEGADVSKDLSMIRLRKSNYCQIIKRDVIVSGTVRAVRTIGIDDEFTAQIRRRAAECLLDLEKSIILSKLSGNTLGSSSAYRTLKGLWDFVATNNTSVATLTASVLDDVIQNAWDNGGKPNLIVADPTWKRLIDQWNSSRVQITNTDAAHRNRVDMYAGSFGEYPVIISRYMPNRSVLAIDTEKVNVMPLTGRSFQFQPTSKTGDSDKGMVLGEYTLEVMNEEGMAKAHA